MRRNEDPCGVMGVMGWGIAILCILIAVAFIIENLMLIIGIILAAIGFGAVGYLIYLALRDRF